MKLLAAIAFAAAIAGAAQAQPPVAGETVNAFEMAPDRTVIFEPQADGKLKILKVTDKDRLAPMPRNPGQVAVAMTVAREIGAVIEFNSGLDYDFSYQASTGEAVSIHTCPVRGDAVAQDQWPEGYKAITIGQLKRVTNAATCETAAN